tara:strand:+ start:113 stop:328 length:216 start_codon:yes stop_codon:yes gene_type:complete
VQNGIFDGHSLVYLRIDTNPQPFQPKPDQESSWNIRQDRNPYGYHPDTEQIFPTQKAQTKSLDAVEQALFV